LHEGCIVLKTAGGYRKVIMKLFTMFAALLLSGVGVATSAAQVPKNRPAEKVRSLLDAEEQGLVRASYESNGGSSGDSIILTLVKVRSAATLMLSVPAGLYLSSSSKSSQDMVISSLRGRDTGDDRFQVLRFITLTDNQPHRFVISAYCAEFHRDNPSVGSAFKAADALDEVAACIFDSARARRLSVTATQAAIWIYRDHVQFDQMNARMTITFADWGRAQSVATACQAKFPE
jgi:hypothetical protein